MTLTEELVFRKAGPQVFSQELSEIPLIRIHAPQVYTYKKG
jgi:hypothetical protein